MAIIKVLQVSERVHGVGILKHGREKVAPVKFWQLEGSGSQPSGYVVREYSSSGPSGGLGPSTSSTVKQEAPSQRLSFFPRSHTKRSKLRAAIRWGAKFPAVWACDPLHAFLAISSGEYGFPPRWKRYSGGNCPRRPIAQPEYPCENTSKREASQPPHRPDDGDLAGWPNQIPCEVLDRHGRAWVHLCPAKATIHGTTSSKAGGRK